MLPIYKCMGQVGLNKPVCKKWPATAIVKLCACRAGTALGDPIEVGAAATVLLNPGLCRSSALHLTAAKSLIGHAEPAAGIVGIIKLASILEHTATDPLLHLGTVNAYVASTLRAAAQHGAAYCASAPRQRTNGGSRTALVGGISSFAFQGTNAHAVLAQEAHSTRRQPLPFNPNILASKVMNTQRLWALPAAHPLIAKSSLTRVKAPGLSVAFDCNLLSPRLALFAHHAVFGRILFPGVGILEAALGAGRTLADASLASQLSVHGMAIVHPIILPQMAGKQKDEVLLRCSIHPAAANFQLSHHSGPPRRWVDTAAGRFALATSMVDNAPAMLAAQAVGAKQVLLHQAPFMTKGIGTPVGNISGDSKLSIGAYLVPPPWMDSCLHLGVVSPGCSARIPVALGAFVLPASTQARPVTLVGSTTAQRDVSTSATDISSFNLAASDGSALASLANLETKKLKQNLSHGRFMHRTDWKIASYQSTLTEVVKKSSGGSSTNHDVQAVGAAAIGSGPSTHPCTMYGTQLQVDMDVACLHASPNSSCSDQQWLFETRHQACKVPACFLAAIQQASSGPKGLATPVVRLQSDLKLPLPALRLDASTAMHAASLRALLTVATAEHPELQFRSATRCEWDANVLGYCSEMGNATVAGGRTLFQPRLLHQSAALLPTHAHVAPQPRGSFANMRLVQHDQDPEAGGIKVDRKWIASSFIT